MDAIGDTQLAVRAYLEEESESRSDGWSYLIIYGVLQVLYVQQDAARTIANVLRLPFQLPAELRSIRQDRNAAIGHPTDSRQGSAAISRMSLKPGGFMMVVHPKGRRAEFRGVNVKAAAEKQTVLMGDLLQAAAEALVSEERDHRQRFRKRPLLAMLPDTLGHTIVDLSKGLSDPSMAAFSIACGESILNSVERFEAGIEERGLTVPYHDTVGGTVEDIRFALNRLTLRLKGNMETWTDQDADVYWFFLRAKVDELRGLAQEIDEQYNSDDI